MCLYRLLEVEGAEENIPIQERRMVVIEHEGMTWVFPAEEVARIDRFEASKITNVPVTVAKSTANYLKGMLEWDGKFVGLIDEELLFYSLQRRLG